MNLLNTLTKIFTRNEKSTRHVDRFDVSDYYELVDFVKVGDYVYNERCNTFAQIDKLYTIGTLELADVVYPDVDGHMVVETWATEDCEVLEMAV